MLLFKLFRDATVSFRLATTGKQEGAEVKGEN